MCSCARFSLEQSQTRGDRLETRLEANILELHSRPALQTQASEEGLAASVEQGAEAGTVNTGPVGAAAADDKSDEVWNREGSPYLEHSLS